MKRYRRRRASNKARSHEELLGIVYMKTALYVMNRSATSRKTWERAIGAAVAGDVQKSDVDAEVKRGLAAGQDIMALVDQDPDIVIKLTPAGWSVETDDA